MATFICPNCGFVDSRSGWGPGGRGCCPSCGYSSWQPSDSDCDPNWVETKFVMSVFALWGMALSLQSIKGNDSLWPFVGVSIGAAVGFFLHAALPRFAKFVAAIAALWGIYRLYTVFAA